MPLYIGKIASFQFIYRVSTVKQPKKKLEHSKRRRAGWNRMYTVVKTLYEI